MHLILGSHTALPVQINSSNFQTWMHFVCYVNDAADAAYGIYLFHLLKAIYLQDLSIIRRIMIILEGKQFAGNVHWGGDSESGSYRGTRQGTES